MELSLGLSYRFDFAPRSIDPVVHLALSDLLTVIRGERSPWTALHLGTEVRLLRFLALRAGSIRVPDFRRRSAGAPAGSQRRLLHPGDGASTRDQPSSGLALEAALRL